MYFELFPTVDYVNFGQTNSKTVTNITKRPAVRQAIKDNLTVFTKHTIRSGETPESLAFDLYGDAELHWIILLTNDIYDRYHQWPMNVNQFQAYVNEKYSDPFATHHFEISQTSGNTTIKIDIGQDDTDHSGATAVTNYQYEQDRQDRLRQIKLVDPSNANQFISDFSKLMEE